MNLNKTNTQTEKTYVNLNNTNTQTQKIEGTSLIQIHKQIKMANRHFSLTVFAQTEKRERSIENIR